MKKLVKSRWERFWAWWDTARSSLVTHRRLKWLWVLMIPLSFFWREALIWVVFMSHYAIIVGHWSSEEAAKTEVKQEEKER
jgi:hypothetical protein